MADRYLVGIDKVDAVYIGSDEVDAIYIGSTLIYPLGDEDVYGAVTMTSTSTLDVAPSVEFSAAVDMESSASMEVKGSVNDEVEGAVTMSSSATMEVACLQFEMYVTSTVEPSIISTSNLIIEEESTNYWRVYSYETVTYFYFDYFDYDMSTEVTEVEVTIGDTITDLTQTFYRLKAMTDFTWNGACKATTMASCFASAESLVNLTLFDTSNVTDFSNCWNSLLSYTGAFPDFDYSSALTLSYCWNGSAIRNFGDIDAPLCTSFEGTFANMSSLLYVGDINSPSGTAFRIMFLNSSSLICIGSIDTTNATDLPDRMFEGCTSLLNPDITNQGIIEAGADWTNPSPCPQAYPEPPIYLMTEALRDDGVYQYLHNSSASGISYDGRLEHSSLSNDDLEGTPWWPSNASYPDDPLPAEGWINLDVNGNATRQINTQWTPPVDAEWVITGIYDVVVGTSYKMYSIHYDGNGACDIYEGSNTGGVEVPLALTFEGLSYTPPTTPWIILATPPEIINTEITGIIYEMDDFYTE